MSNSSRKASPSPRHSPEVGRALLDPLAKAGVAVSPTPATVEEFKRRLSRDLHDECGQTMALLQLRLAMLQAALPPERSDLAANTADISALVARLSSRLHLLCADLRSPVWPTEGLLSMLRRLVAEITVLTPHLQILLHAPDDGRHWPAPHQEALYHICQEALTNTLRHAHAKRVVIDLHEKKDTLILTVCDNGDGFIPGSEPLRSQGLAGMRERLELLGGMLQIESMPGQGTLIRALLPLAPAGADD
jgi:signal transduction histidine kinase